MVGNSHPQTCSSSWQRDIKVNRVHRLEYIQDIELHPSLYIGRFITVMSFQSAKVLVLSSTKQMHPCFSFVSAFVALLVFAQTLGSFICMFSCELESMQMLLANSI